jgi:hypothetical protein
MVTAVFQSVPLRGMLPCVAAGLGSQRSLHFQMTCWNFDTRSAQFQAPGLQVPLSILGSNLFGTSVSAT